MALCLRRKQMPEGYQFTFPGFPARIRITEALNLSTSGNDINCTAILFIEALESIFGRNIKLSVIVNFAIVELEPVECLCAMATSQFE